MPRRVFTNALTTGRDPVVYAINGHLVAGYDDHKQPIPGDPWESQDFTCLPDMPATAMDVLTTTVADGPSGTTYNVPSVIDFLALCLVPPDRDAFQEIVRDPSILIANTTLVDIMQYVASELAGGRPTRR